MEQGDPSTRWLAGGHVRMPEETNVWAQGATTYKCPACGSHDTRKSYPAGALDYLILMFNRWPYRCRKCSNRFIRKVPRTYTDKFLKPDDSVTETEKPVENVERAE